jgi:type I restriction enzyme S subunit
MADYHSGHLADYYTGATIKHLTGQDLARYEIPLPPIAEQRRIADVLDRAEALRAKRRAALAQLDTLTQAIFLDLFGDPVTNPKGWPTSKIGDLLESASYGTNQKCGGMGEFPVLRMNNITRSGEINLTSLKFMDVAAGQRDRYLLRVGDVLFNRTNSADLVGKTALFRDAKRMAYAGYLVRLRVNNENDPEYLAAFLNTDYAKRVLRRMCKSIIGMANISASEIKLMKILVPPAATQRAFANHVAAVEKLKAAQRASLVQMDALFASLQHRAFRGEL